MEGVPGAGAGAVGWVGGVLRGGGWVFEESEDLMMGGYLMLDGCVV